MTPAEHERLSILIEECAEVVAAGGKILRHGFESYNPQRGYGSPTNRNDLEKELGHVLHAMRRMISRGDLNESHIEESVLDKALTIGQWLHHQPKGST